MLVWINRVVMLTCWAMFCVSNTLLAQPLWINEVVSSNSTLLDEDGDTPDWLELRNTANVDVELAGYYLSDDPVQPDKWMFGEVSIPAQGYLKVWASDKDRPVGMSVRTLVSAYDSWRYWVPASPVTPAWRTLSFSDSGWNEGNGGFGYGDEDDVTLVPGGTGAIYLRKLFTVADKDAIQELLFDVDYDDGFVAYLNGVEIARANINGVLPNYQSTAITDREAQLYSGGTTERFVVEDVAEILVNGVNILAIQVHNISAFSSDLTILPFLTAIYNTISTEGSIPPDVLSFGSACPHTNFKLSAAGETLYLFDPSLELVDSLQIPATLPADYAVGRLANMPEEIRLFDVITPNAENPNTGWLGALAPAIEFSQMGGIVTPFSLSLSGVDAPGVIRYTTDATEPTASSLLYSGPVFINDNQVIRARVFRDNYLPSPTQTQTYLFNTDHELPVVSLVTDPDNFFDEEHGIYVTGNNAAPNFPFFGANFWEDWERPVHFSLYETDGSLGVELNAGIKIFGGWSRGFDQRSLSIFARNQYGSGAIEYPLFPDRPYDEFQALVLRNSGNDWLNGNMRDAVQTGLLRDADLETQAYRPVAVYLNGEYWGMYGMREKVNEHYLASRHDLDPAEINLLEFSGDAIHGSNEAYGALIDFVANNTLTNSANYEEAITQIDIDNFILYQLSQIYFDNTDWPGNNIKFWQAENEPFRWILFDTDFGFAIWNYFAYNNNTLSFALEANGTNWPNPPWSTLLLRRLTENQDFRHRFINRFADEMNTRFLPDRVCEHIDTMAARIESEIPRHFNRWGANSNDWYGQIDVMKNFANFRPASMKGFILNQFNLNSYHQLTVQINDPQRGIVQLNSLRLDDYTWQGDYFAGVPVALTAIPLPGYAFSHWEVASSSTESSISLNVNSQKTIRAIFETTAFSDPIINEICYNPGPDQPSGDWIELYNPNPQAVDLSGWYIQDEDDSHVYEFPTGTALEGNGYLVIARNIGDFQSVHLQVSSLVGPFNFGLSSSGDAVRLFDNTGTLRDIVEYQPEAPWPPAANGQGPTLELIDSQLDNSLPTSWANLHPYGSPGRHNDPTVSTEQRLSVNQLVLSPNPVQDHLNVSFTTGASLVQLQWRIHDAVGQVVLEGSLPASDFSISTSLKVGHLPAGNYTLVLSDGEHWRTERFVVGE